MHGYALQDLWSPARWHHHIPVTAASDVSVVCRRSYLVSFYLVIKVHLFQAALVKSSWSAPKLLILCLTWIRNLKSEIYSLHTSKYLLPTLKLKDVIINAVYSTSQSKSMAFYQRHHGLFNPLPSHTNSVPVNLITAAISYWNWQFYVLFHTKAGFATF